MSSSVGSVRAGGAGPFVAGTVFADRYRMIEPLGRGAIGEVWRADDLVLQTPVALKLIGDATPDDRARIVEEARLARRVTHPAVRRVFDVGEADGIVFCSMALVEGEDLGTLLRRAGRLPSEKVLDIGCQICDGLATAHAQGVLHRDIRGENVLIDEDGFVCLTDFGVATADTSGEPASERADVYGVALLLYELLVGTPAFPAGAKRTRLPQRPSALVPDVDVRLERAIMSALSPKPRRRPASAEAMIALLLGAAAPERRIGRWAAVAALVASVGVLAVVASRLPFGGANAPLSNRDTIVVADVTNTTGEPVFDGTLKVALAVALEQSPFLKVYPDERIRETLRLMQQPADTRVTRDLAREIAIREQVKALVDGSIGKLGSHYVIAVEAVNAQSGDVIAREQTEVGAREEVLTSLGRAVARLRATLGESLASIRRFDVPLARATTSSLDALHSYSVALDEGRVNPRADAIPQLQRAIELDPQFALAQATLSGVYANSSRSADAPVYSRRAFELRDRVSERERFFISWRYYVDAAQAWDKALPLAESWARTYPREATAFNSLGMASAAFGRHDAAVDAFRTALRLDPRFLPPYGNLVGSLTALGRFDDARAVLRDAASRGIDALSLRRAGYTLAFIAGDTTAMASALLAARTTDAAALPSLNWEAHTLAFAGRTQEAHDLFQRGIREAAARANQRELAAQWATEDAETHAVGGDCGSAGREVTAAIALSRDSFTLQRAARTLAVCGDEAEAAALAGELAARFPDANLTREIQLPVIGALRALHRGDARGAIDRLLPVAPYDDAPSAELWPTYVRGDAYLRLQDRRRAAAEFQRLLDHRGQAPASPLHRLAAEGLRRATASAR